MIARVKDVLNYFLRDHTIPEACTCKHLGIIIHRSLSWDDQVTWLTKAWKALHFIIHIFKKRNRNMKHVVYTSLVCTILEYGAAGKVR